MTTPELNDFEDPPDNEPAVPAAIEVPAGAGHLLRPARALIGWVPPGLGEQMWAFGPSGTTLTDERRARLQKAHDAVAARPADIDQEDLVTDLPLALAGHVDRLRGTTGAQMIAAGWRVAMVDLGRVVAFQPHVFTDTPMQRVESLDADDLEAVAELTLPTAHTSAIQVHHDQLTQTYVFRSPNLNLRVMSSFGGLVAEANGAPVFGFVVGEPPSFMQVINVGGRFVLNDGYHRAFGLLDRGITRVPAFIRDCDTPEGFVPAGMLPREAWLGDRPPSLRDYHNDVVAGTVYQPAPQKMVMIRATELALPS